MPLPSHPEAPAVTSTLPAIARHRVAFVLLAAGLLFGSMSVAAQTSAGVAAQIRAALPGAGALLGKSALTHGAAAALQQVYAADGNQPLWTPEGTLTPQARALLEALAQADRYGLRTEDYDAGPLQQLAVAVQSGAGGREAQLARLDTHLSAAGLRFISDLHFGRVDPQAAGFKLQEPREPFDLGQALVSLAAATDEEGAITAVEPVFYHYKLLKDALARYRKLAPALDGAPLPSPAASLKVGSPYAGAAALRHRLEVLGDLPAAAPAAEASPLFDENLSEGVRHFQDRHGLAPDGVLGKGTLKALNTPIAERIRQISLTLERWRWLPPFKSPPIIVNIPQFRLFAFRTTEDRVADILQMRVIVGRTFASSQTPVFEGDMRYVVLRPYWDVPASITRREMLPKIEANPQYLARQRLEIVNGQGDASPVVAPTPANLELLAAGKLRLRQQPGEDNALGLVKFMFPNSYNVYLHSTPAHRLFQETVRAFSHGCIRVADPVALATLVLKDAPGDWTAQSVAAAMNGTKNSVRINLPQPIQVLILYGTALATEDGAVLFFEDLYGYDHRLERQLGLAPVR
jgi:murein L,D-transpeptidase YcbB/YkuD